MIATTAVPRSSSAPLTAPASPWIVGARYDQWFMVGSWLVPFILWAIASQGAAGFMIAFAIFIFIDRSHVVATWPMTFFDRPTMREHGWWYTIGFFTLCELAVFCSYVGGQIEAIWVSLFLYWGAFHILRQHYGFLRLYQAFGVRPDAHTARMEIICLYSGAAAPYLLNLAMGWGQAATPFRLFVPPIPMPLVWTALAIFIWSLVPVVSSAVRHLREGSDAGKVRLLYLALALSNFWIACLGPGRQNIMLAALFITSFHNLQYSALVWYVLHKRYSAPGAAKDNLLSFVFRLNSPLLYVAMILVGAFVWIMGQGFLPIAQAFYFEHRELMRYVSNLVFATVYAHYLFDGKLWQMRKNPRLRAELGLAGAR